MTLFLSLFLFMCTSCLMAQNNPTWDDSKAKDWPISCQKIEITSSLDGQTQSAYFRPSVGPQARPLIVSLHTWSGGYTQKDTLSWLCIDKNYTYIHPDFRGPNNTPKACGSKYAIQDIEDAISYAIQHAQVDMSEIHVIGVSGGGYATLLSYMKTKHPVKTYSAWVPISDIQKWYYESKGRGTKYALDIAKSTVEGVAFNKDYFYLGKEEAINRSPYYMNTPTEQRQNSKLYIYAGIHDGYRGSVPITQSLLFYNKLVRDFEATNTEAMISDSDIIEMVASRGFQRLDKGKIGDRMIHYEKHFKDLIKLIIFEGGHEMLSEVALDHLR